MFYFFFRACNLKNSTLFYSNSSRMIQLSIQPCAQIKWCECCLMFSFNSYSVENTILLLYGITINGTFSRLFLFCLLERCIGLNPWMLIIYVFIYPACRWKETPSKNYHMLNFSSKQIKYTICWNKKNVLFLLHFSSFNYIYKMSSEEYEWCKKLRSFVYNSIITLFKCYF